MQRDKRRAEDKELKRVINMYHPSSELKPKESPVASNLKLIANGHAKAHEPLHYKQNSDALEDLACDCRAIISRIKLQRKKAEESKNSVLSVVKLYYEQIVSVVQLRHRNTTNKLAQSFGSVLDGLERKIESAEELMTSIEKSRRDLKQKDQAIKFYRAELSKTAKIQIPLLEVQAVDLKDLEKVIAKFQPTVFCAKSPTENLKLSHKFTKSELVLESHALKQINFNKITEQPHENTIKKTKSNPGESNPRVCQFSCDQVLEWDLKRPDDRKFDKHEIISEIIMEEPSSCEDSLMLNDNP